MSTVRVFETFVSIQGESSYAGLPCFFVRLAGCNLHCTYCDTASARGEGEEVEVRSVVAEATRTPVPLVEITGGEPLLQEGFRDLALALRDGTGKTVLVETNGSRDISAIPDDVIAVMDVKCPGSGEADGTDLRNLERLRPGDEVKFVLTGREDYGFARGVVEEHDLLSRVRCVWFGPAWDRLSPYDVARWILDDGLGVRVQVQLHKILGVP